MTLPTVPITDESPISGIPISESADAEENRLLRLRMMEMWDAWANGREPPSAIPGFPELFPRASGTSNIPINYPNTPLGYPTISANFVGTPSEARPQVLDSGAASNIFTAPPCSATAQPTLPRPSFDPSSFTFQTPSFPLEPTQFPTYTYSQPPRHEFTAVQEKATKTPEQEEIAKKMRNIATCCEESVGGKNSSWPISEKVWQFQYNIDIAPDRNSLTNLKKKSSESFREYAVKWREQASGVKPPMDEIEMVTVFLQAQEADHFQNMMSAMGKPFAEAIKIGEMPVPQTRQNPASPAYRAGTRCAYHSGAEGHDTDDCWTLKRAVENLIEQRKIVLRDEDIPNVTNNQLPAHNNRPVIGMICEDKEFDPALKAIIVIADVEKKPKASPKQDKGEKKNKTTPPKSEKKVEVETGPMPPKNAILYVPRGRKEKQMTLSPPRRFELNKTTQMYVPKGAYVMWGPINPPRLSEPVVIGRASQKPMTDPTAMPWNYNKLVVTYKGKEISGEVQENNPAEKYFNLEEVNNATGKCFPSKKPVSAEEAEAFFRKMKMADYEVIDQLREFPAQVSLLSLLMNSTEHQNVLIQDP
ncbi:uncharacterized protein [Nicotiana sylvestris]|uniref:uncharacterized protein n=1 Tax=Nicotiana sylvestris TaxID=4096 RepID=UPI00388C8720